MSEDGLSPSPTPFVGSEIFTSQSFPRFTEYWAIKENWKGIDKHCAIVMKQKHNCFFLQIRFDNVKTACRWKNVFGECAHSHG